jgi:hypothetical protein
VQLTEVDYHREHREEKPTVWAMPGFVSAFFVYVFKKGETCNE